MDESKDFRAVLLLVIPTVWMILQLFPDGFRVSLLKDSEKHMQWEMSQITFLPANITQKDVLISLYELKNVPVNQADAELLTIVPGIGPALAKRIVDERERSGFFHEPVDLTRVHGIGDKRVEQFQTYLSFD
jgi:competence ComEA-like helix-hairpin-helix protein